jgi:hypothetical protein
MTEDAEDLYYTDPLCRFFAEGSRSFLKEKNQKTFANCTRRDGEAAAKRIRVFAARSRRFGRNDV